tara:strand:+ start:406 stop:780 length:375 start_codon:yes stop_codon:yes gene_type:complete
VDSAEIGEKWVLASWQPNAPGNPEGVVLINVEHPVIEAGIIRWQELYPIHHAEAVREVVTQAYGEIAVAKVAHSEQLKALIPSRRIDDVLRSDESLTMALLGLIAEEAVISVRLRKLGRKKKSA